MAPLIVSSSPHIQSGLTTRRVMLDVVIALLPTSAAAVWLFGLDALLQIVASVAAAVLSEWCFEKITRRKNTIGDLSAVVTGLMVALMVPSAMPLWQTAFGSVVAIVVIKQLFGGIGKNFANPAVTGRIVMMLAFTSTITVLPQPRVAADIVSTATPLGLEPGGVLPSYMDMLLGRHAGCIGEVCALAILLGGAYLLVRRVITWHAPVAFLGTAAVLSVLLGQDVLYQLLSGGLMLGAFFMATDYATTPPTAWGRIWFGVGCGVITMVIRVYGSYPEGVSFAILLMNILTPYLSRWTRQKVLGGAKA